MLRKIIVLISLFMLSIPVVCNGFESYDDKKTLLIVGADWCGYCVKLKKDLPNMDLEKYVVINLNVDENPDLKKKYNIKKIPTSIILDGDNVIDKKIGYDKRSYIQWLKDNE